MARHPKVRIIPPRKLSVSKCRSGGGKAVGGMTVLGAIVVRFVTGTVGDGVVTVVLFGDTGGVVDAGGCGEVVGFVTLAGVGSGGPVIVTGVDTVVVGVFTGSKTGIPGSLQRATAHSP